MTRRSLMQSLSALVAPQPAEGQLARIGGTLVLWAEGQWLPIAWGLLGPAAFDPVGYAVLEAYQAAAHRGAQ